jgi:putative ABC transport system substrate-binding protein
VAADLVSHHVAAIVAHDTISAIAAKAATTTIPIIFTTGGDPVRDGLVENLNRRGSNVTGTSFMAVELGAKQVGLLHELRVRAARIAVLVDPKWPLTEQFVSNVRTAALAIGQQIEPLNASSGGEIDALFTNLSQKPAHALLVGPSALTNNRRVQIAMLAAYHRILAIYPFREFAEAGGLMSYGASITDANRQTGVYTARILKGEKPADLPVMRSAKFEFVINLNTPKAFGLSLPPGLLAVADEVIE